MISPELVLTSPKFLFDVYVFGRKTAAEKHPREQQTTTATASDSQPNPEQLQELIKELEEHPAPDEQAVSTAIDKKFPPQQAVQVKNDLAAISAISSPPNFDDYNYYGIFSQYVRAVRDIAIRTELFKLRGSKDPNGLRLLLMRKTSSALVPAEAYRFAVSRYGDMASAKVASTEVLLTDRNTDTPLVVVIRAEFTHASYGVFCGVETDRKAQVYFIKQGDDTNWFRFDFPDRYRAEPGFGEFSYRLTAANAKLILGAVKEDLSDYLREIEEEKPVVKELGDELAAILRVTQPLAKS